MIILSTAYLAPVQYYAHLYAADRAMEDCCEHYLKQTYRNRCYIATPEGAMPLTVPVERNGAAHTAVRDLRLSDHGNWRHLHWTALASAYEGSPYFEYYADDFRPHYERSYKYLADFNEALRHTVMELLSLDTPIEQASVYVAEVGECDLDLRNVISPKAPIGADVRFVPQSYWQVFQQRTGFLPNLSIVDLLFNVGPESRLILRKSLQ